MYMYIYVGVYNINSITYEMFTTLSLYLYKTLASDCNFVALNLLELL